jgi:hypothetical protein
MTNSLSLDSFRSWFEKAVRVEEDIDWQIHTIDYAAFKERLRHFSRRRAKLRAMLRESPTGRISEQVLMNVLGTNDISNNITIAQHASPAFVTSPVEMEELNKPVNFNSNDDNTSIGLVPSTNYMPFDDVEPTSSDSPSDNSDSQGSGRDRGRGKNKRNVMRRVSIVERREMIKFLTWEMDKVQMFYLSQWQRLTLRLEQLQQTGLSDYGLGDEILELMAFCVINIVTARQILIRYDAFVRAFSGIPMIDFYMKKVTKHPTSFRKIMNHEELNAVANSYAESLQSAPISINFEAQRIMFRDILSQTQSAQSMSSNGHNLLTDSFIYTLRDWFLTGAFEDRLGLEPAYLTSRGTSLTEEMKQLAEWRKKKHEILQPKREEKQLTGMQIFHLTLNLVSAFLYCMNYYIVEPSSTMYVNQLGAHDAMSGTLIGMLPLGALVSSIPYSMWTNKSFRHPFLMSCCMMIIGNLVYGLADRYSNVKVALLGRFISGLGAPKCIIRRYMADTTPVTLRTSVNAGFGMVVAAGSAMGPAMAIILNRFDYTVVLPWLGFVTFNGLTLPGYFMACCWFTFTIVVLATFEEPDREGLEEQKRLEASRQPTVSPSTSRVDMSSDSSRHHDLNAIFSDDDDDEFGDALSKKPSHHYDDKPRSCWQRSVAQVQHFFELVSFPVRLCLGLLFAKVFTIEALVSATSALSKNRYGWQVHQVGTLGFLNGILVIPFSILVGRLSMSYHDHVLMKWLVCIGCMGMFCLIDVTDLVGTPTSDWNEGHVLAVSPQRYIVGYFLAYLSIQTFEGVIGSTLSKVIPTALAAGTLNSGLLATLVDCSGRASGDLFISLCGFIEIRQLMNLLFIPGFCIMLTCLVVIVRYRDMLAV